MGSALATQHVDASSARIHVLRYDADTLQELPAATLDQAVAALAQPGIVWIDVNGARDPALIDQVGRALDLHPLVIEDAQSDEHRAKLDDLDGYLFLVLTPVHTLGDGEPIERATISLVLGPSYLVSFSHGQSALFDPVRERIRTARGRIRALGADYLAHALVDTIVDSYFAVLESVADRLEEIEEELLTDPDPTDLPALYQVRQDLLTMRHAVWPMRDTLVQVQRRDSPLVAATTAIYFRDIYDHAVQLVDTIETLREMASGLFDLYLSSISNRLNEVMKVLTIISTLFIPLTFLTGVYGMNFHHMPELGWRWGYPMVWGIATALVLFMLWLFRRKGWL
jgi:magnesium transporter